MLDLNLKTLFIDQVLGPIGVIVGLLVAIPVFWTWYDVVWGRRRKHGVWLKKAAANSGRLPAVLIVDMLAGRDMGAAVRHFMAADDALKAIPAERIITVSRDCDLKPDDMPALAREIQDAVGTVSRHGADELYVFLGSPGCVSAMVGAELSNVSCKVLLFQNDRASKTYVNFGPLRHPRF